MQLLSCVKALLFWATICTNTDLALLCHQVYLESDINSNLILV